MAVQGERQGREIVVERAESRVRALVGTLVGIVLLALAVGVWTWVRVPPVP
jgi:hypothetical protein